MRLFEVGLVSAVAICASSGAAFASPQFSYKPDPVDFMSVMVGQKTMPLAVTITNTGDATLHLKSFDLLGPDSADFMIPDPLKPPMPLGLSLNKGVTISFHVTFAPSHSGTESAYVGITTDDPMNQSAQVQLTGVGAQAMVMTSPGMLDFGMVQVGSASTAQTVTVSNMGMIPAMIDAVTFTGANPTSFKANTNGPIMILPNMSASVMVKMQPVDSGMLAATLNLMSGMAALATVSVTGQGLPSPLAVNPRSLDFGMVAVGDRSPPQTVALKNNDMMPLSLNAIGLDNPTQFAVDSSQTALLLAPGQVSVFSVTFTPTMNGPVNGQVNILKGNQQFAFVTLAGVGGGNVHFDLSAGARDLSVGGGGGEDAGVFQQVHHTTCALGRGPVSGRAFALALGGVLAALALSRRRRGPRAR